MLFLTASVFYHLLCTSNVSKLPLPKTCSRISILSKELLAWLCELQDLLMLSHPPEILWCHFILSFILLFGMEDVSAGFCRSECVSYWFCSPGVLVNVVFPTMVISQEQYSCCYQLVILETSFDVGKWHLWKLNCLFCQCEQPSLIRFAVI